METKLLEFVREVQTLADVRNLDPRNPVALDFDFPSMSMRFRVVGSITEPTYQAYPINALWVVLDANSPYYNRVLKLKSATANDSTVEGRVTDVAYLGTWIEITAYDDMFTDPQFYAMGDGGGTPGPAGKDGYILRGNWDGTLDYDKDHTVYHDGNSYASLIDNNVAHEPGTTGWETFWILVAREGDTPEIDYDAIVEEALRRLTPKLTGLQIRNAPAEMFAQGTVQLQAWAQFSNGTERNVTSNVTWSVNTEAGTITTGGLLAAATVANDLSAIVNASFSDGADTQTTSVSILVRKIVPISLTVAGPATVAENTTAQYTATVRYNNNTTVSVPANGRTWSVSPSSVGTINTSGLLTAAEVSANLSGTVRCEYVEGGVTVSGTRAITVSNTVIVPKARFGAGARVTDTAQFTSSFVNTVCGTEVATAGPTNTFNLALERTNGVDQFGYYAHPKSWGVLRFEDLDAQGFFGGWDGARNNILDPSKWGPFEVQATVNGVTEAWYVYRTDRQNLGNTRWSITPTP